MLLLVLGEDLGSTQRWSVCISGISLLASCWLGPSLQESLMWTAGLVPFSLVTA